MARCLLGDDDKSGENNNVEDHSLASFQALILDPDRENETTHPNFNLVSNPPKAEDLMLAALPTEILEIIAGHLEDHNLPALRLASKICNAKVLQIFARLFFTELPVLLCYEESLKAAIEVARHPVFGTAIRSLEVCINILPDEDDFDSYPEEIPEGNTWTAAKPLYDRLHEGKETGKSRELIHELINSLDRDHVDTMHISAGPGGSYLRQTTFWDQGGVHAGLNIYSDLLSLDHMFTEISFAKFPITKITRSTNNCFKYIQDFDDATLQEADTASLPGPYGDVFSRLKHLEIAVTSSEVDQGLAEPSFRTFAAVLTKAVKLKKLYLTGDKSCDPETVATLMRHLDIEDFPDLQVLGIENAIVSARDLRAFARSRHLLVDLGLVSMPLDKISMDCEDVEGDENFAELKRIHRPFFERLFADEEWGICPAAEETASDSECLFFHKPDHEHRY